MQITEKKFIEAKKELANVSLALEKSLEEQSKAAAQGDLSENEEYATARANSSRLMNRKKELERVIEEAVIVSDDNSPRIALGSKIEVTRVNEKDEPIAETRTFTLEAEGDTILKKVIGVDSPLGKEILNGVDGVYQVQNNGGIRYYVKKIVGG